MDVKSGTEADVVPFWNHTRLSEQLKEVVEEVEIKSKSPTHTHGSTDIASVLAIFGGILLVLTLWAFIKHFLAANQSVCNCRKPEDFGTPSQATQAASCTIGHDSTSSVVGMARVVARVQAGLVKPAELPPPYEAPPSYKVALAMSRETPPPDYLLREAVIV